jgi:hypothetical protein
MTPRDVIGSAGLRFGFHAAFPRLGYLLRWPTRLGRRGLLGWIAVKTALIFAVLHWVVPALRRHGDEMEGIKGDLRASLGRDPTSEELWDERIRRRAG